MRSVFSTLTHLANEALTSDNDIFCSLLWESALVIEGLIGSDWTGTNEQTLDELKEGGAGSLRPPSQKLATAISGRANSQVHWNLLGNSMINKMKGLSREFMKISSLAKSISN